MDGSRPVSETRLRWCSPFRNLRFRASVDQTRVMRFSDLDHSRRPGFPVKSSKTKVKLHEKGSRTNAILLGGICVGQRGPAVGTRLLLRAEFSLNVQIMSADVASLLQFLYLHPMR